MAERATLTHSSVVIGALCEDRVKTPGGARRGLGGTSYYFPAAFRALGGRAACVSKAEDEWVFRELERAGVATDGVGRGSTACFELVYEGGKRTLRLLRHSSVIRAEDIPPRMLAFEALHFGPVEEELDPSIWTFRRSNFRLVTLDIQGLSRDVDRKTGIVRAQRRLHPAIRRAIRSVDVVKFDEGEARALLGNRVRWEDAIADLEGPQTIIVTLGEEGALLFEDGRSHSIPAYPSDPVDWTGAGDCFMAGYVFRSLQGRDSIEAAKFGSALAATMIEKPRPTRFPSAREVADKMKLGTIT